MFSNCQLEYIKAISPIHAGTGQGLGLIDMPIQRESHTSFPKIEGSSLKGAIKFHIYNEIRDYNRPFEDDKNKIEFTTFYDIFGSDENDSNDDSKASRIVFTDAKLLFFPVKAVDRLFYYVSCPYILKRWQDEIESDAKFDYSSELKEGNCICFNGQEKIILEDYLFESKSKDKDEKIFEEDKLKSILNKENTIIVSDQDFIDLVTMYTEVITRNKINPKTGTAEASGLFTEEYLPSESILYYQVLESPRFSEKANKNGDDNKKLQKPIEYYNKKLSTIFQIGGNKTIGKGLVKRLENISSDKDE